MCLTPDRRKVRQEGLGAERRQRIHPCYELVRAPDEPSATSPDDAAERSASGSSARPFSLSRIPNALAEAVDCDARSRDTSLPAAEPPPEYRTAFEMTLRVRTGTGDAPVLRTMWVKPDGTSRITVYAIEVP